MDQKRLIDAMHQQANGDPMKLLRVAELALAAQDDARLRALCAEMLAAAPAGSPALNFADAVLGKAVPSWHFTMMRDARRNRAYDAALRRAVTPQSRVLEIGTGAGLLAMMAARAGAREVITCEVNPVIAAAAREVIALNGYADQIRVIGKHSSDLTLADIGGRADILVSEIVDSSLLGEGVLGAHEAAMRDLVKPGGVVIPGSGAIRVALIDSPKLERETLGIIDGFDVRPFNRVRRRGRGGQAGRASDVQRSAAIDLFRFDFASTTKAPPAETTVECVASGGRINAIARWIALDLDDATRYENAPGAGPKSCWPVILYHLAEPIESEPGQRIVVHGRHNRTSVTLWTE